MWKVEWVERGANNLSSENKLVQETLQQPRITTELRRRPKQRSKDFDLHLATWNLRTLFARGALQNTTADLIKYRVHIAAVQETRWLDSGIHALPSHSFYFSGSNNNTHEFGTGFFVDKKVDHTVIGFVPISKFICTLRIKTKTHKITMINVHAPTEEQEDDVKDTFYSQLESTINAIPSSDVKITLGDFNAQIGKEDYYREIVGIYSLHSLSNDNGIRMINFAATHGMTIRSTQFQRKNIYKITWNSNDGVTKNQIDHVMIEEGYRNSIYDVRSYRGTLHDSDHALVKIKLRCQWPKCFNRTINTRPKFNVDSLKDSDVKARFEAAVQNELIDEPSHFELNDATKKNQ